MNRAFAGLLVLFAALAACAGDRPPAGAAAPASEPGFKMPPGFVIEVLLDNVPNARSLALGDRGTLFVATRRAGKLYAVPKALDGGREVIVLGERMKTPNGVAFRNGDLYVAEAERILRYRDIESRLAEPGEPEVIAQLPEVPSPIHSWKYIAFGPDGRLYVPLGAPCNVCEEGEFARIISMKPDGSDRRVIARGVRNSVGMDWHPRTGELWFSDNGRDMLGDDVPPCELNRVTRAGQHFGFPFCHGRDIADPELGRLGNCADSVAPAQELGPHVAPLAVRFYTGRMFPSDYRNQVFIAEHGSWNRSKAAGKTGYRVTLVRLSGGTVVSYEPFLEGFLRGDDEVAGRPVDILVAPDGALLVSDDHRGAVYRISYHGD